MKEIKCKECNAYGGIHSPLCSLNTPAQIKEHLRVYFSEFQKQSKSINQIRQHFIKRTKYMNNQMAILQGKIAILKHENNKLRNKINRL